MVRKSESPRAHGRSQNTSKVTFRFPSGAPLVLTVHGRPSEVRAKIQGYMNAGRNRVTFYDLTTGRDRGVNLADVDVWSVK
jgi:hypothetical protein